MGSLLSFILKRRVLCCRRISCTVLQRSDICWLGFLEGLTRALFPYSSTGAPKSEKLLALFVCSLLCKCALGFCLSFLLARVSSMHASEQAYV